MQKINYLIKKRSCGIYILGATAFFVSIINVGVAKTTSTFIFAKKKSIELKSQVK